MNPVERALHVGQPRAQPPNGVGIGSYADANAIYNPVQAAGRLGQCIDIRRHTRTDMFQLGLSEIAYDPPGTRIYEGEQLLAGMRKSAFRNCEIRDTSVKGRI